MLYKLFIIINIIHIFYLYIYFYFLKYLHYLFLFRLCVCVCSFSLNEFAWANFRRKPIKNFRIFSFFSLGNRFRRLLRFAHRMENVNLQINTMPIHVYIYLYVCICLYIKKQALKLTKKKNDVFFFFFRICVHIVHMYVVIAVIACNNKKCYKKILVFVFFSVFNKLRNRFSVVFFWFCLIFKKLYRVEILPNVSVESLA